MSALKQYIIDFTLAVQARGFQYDPKYDGLEVVQDGIDEGLTAEQAAIAFVENILEDDYIDESMDGDHESALASAGWGTDEDYGYFGENEY